jgi:protein tyrosine phosphatase (PTP) superfamily phosphohydrolase (DUF442 family)
MMIEEIYNFLRLSDTLISSGMPTAEQLTSISEENVQVVINLALPTSEKALPNEAELVTSLGMKYIHIPVLWDNPTSQNLVDFMNTMDTHQESKIYVHCQANYRATGFITLYRILRLSWHKDDAFQDLRKIWNPEEVPFWQKFIEENLVGKTK